MSSTGATIHLNPVRASVVAPEKAVDFPWSGLPQWNAPCWAFDLGAKCLIRAHP